MPYECLFLFDTVIYVLTVYKAYKVGQQASTRLPTAGQRLTMLLVRDGMSPNPYVDPPSSFLLTGAVYFA